MNMRISFRDLCLIIDTLDSAMYDDEKDYKISDLILEKLNRLYNELKYKKYNSLIICECRQIKTLDSIYKVKPLIDEDPFKEIKGE